jgi:hypothetical protein
VRGPAERAGGSRFGRLGARRPGYAIRRRIAALDPVADHEEIARLTFEVLYGDPIAVHAAYLVGFARQVAVPGIARVVYRGGGGENLRDVARRTDDTLTLFGAFFHHGHSSPEGRVAITRMEEIHSHFAITDEQKRYTLATLIFEAERIGSHLGFAPFTAGQREASWRFWRGVAEQMPLIGLPASGEDLRRWMLTYERENWGYSDGGRRVVECFFEDWTTRWFPCRARGLGREILLALMEDDLRAALHLEAPDRRVERAIRLGSRAYLPLTAIRPIRTDRSWLDYFGRRQALTGASSRAASFERTIEMTSP